MRRGATSVWLLMMLWVFTGPVHSAAGQNSSKPKGHPAIHLSWNAPATSHDPVDGYNVYRSQDGGRHFRKLNTSPIAKPEYDDPAVRRGASYMYWVKSVDKKGKESGPSNRIQMHVP